MPNAFDMRRYAGMFGGGPQQDPLMSAYRKINFNAPRQQEPVAPEPPAAQEDPFMSAINRLQSGQAAGAYRKHLTDMPDPKAYAPSKWRRLGAALTAGAASFGKTPQNAMELGSEVRDAPLKSALNEWQLKGAGLKEQADIESQDVKGQMEQIKAIREYMKQQNDTEIAKATAESQIRLRDAQIANFESQGWTQSVRPDGNLWMVKPGQEPQNMGPSMEGRKQDWTEKYQGGQQQVAEGKLKDDQRRTGIMGQNANTYAATAGRQGGVVDAQENFQAEAFATQQVLREKPEYKGWVNPNGTIKGPNDYWFGGSMPNPANDKGYADFLARVESAKQRVLGTRRPGAPGAVMTPGGAVNPPNQTFDFRNLPPE